MKTYRPRLIKKPVSFKRTDGSKHEYVELVCSNCGMKQQDSETWPAKKHLKKCEEFKAPYVWTEVNRDGGSEDYMGNVDSFTWSLCCNGRALWCSSGPHDKRTLDALNKHQISPYQYNQEEWRAICFSADYIKEKEKYLVSLEEEKKTFLVDHAESVRKLRRDIKRATANL